MISYDFFVIFFILVLDIFLLERDIIMIMYLNIVALTANLW